MLFINLDRRLLLSIFSAVVLQIVAILLGILAKSIS